MAEPASPTPPSPDDITVAGPMRRLAAIIYDSFLVFALVFFSSWVFIALSGGEQLRGLPYQMFIYCLTWLFFQVFWRARGQTLGMQVWKLRLVGPAGDRVTAREAFIRFLAATVSIACFGIGLLWMFVHPRRLTWHDIVSRTRVVYFDPQNP